MCLVSISISRGDPKVKNYTAVEGKALVAFLKNYVEFDVDQINKGHAISLRVPNAEESDRSFYSIQLFLVRPVESKESEVDIFEVTSGRKGGDINFLMNISDEKLQASYVVFREEHKDNPRKETEWVETTIRLSDLLAANHPKGEQGGAGQLIPRSMSKSQGEDKPQPKAERRSR